MAIHTNAKRTAAACQGCFCSTTPDPLNRAIAVHGPIIREIASHRINSQSLRIDRKGDFAAQRAFRVHAQDRRPGVFAAPAKQQRRLHPTAVAKDIRPGAHRNRGLGNAAHNLLHGARAVVGNPYIIVLVDTDPARIGTHRDGGLRVPVHDLLHGASSVTSNPQAIVPINAERRRAGPDRDRWLRRIADDSLHRTAAIVGNPNVIVTVGADRNRVIPYDDRRLGNSVDDLLHRAGCIVCGPNVVVLINANGPAAGTKDNAGLGYPGDDFYCLVAGISHRPDVVVFVYANAVGLGGKRNGGLGRAANDLVGFAAGIACRPSGVVLIDANAIRVGTNSDGGLGYPVNNLLHRTAAIVGNPYVIQIACRHLITPYTGLMVAVTTRSTLVSESGDSLLSALALAQNNVLAAVIALAITSEAPYAPKVPALPPESGARAHFAAVVPEIAMVAPPAAV